MQTQSPQATYAIVPGALASTTNNNNHNHAQLNNNNQANTSTSSYCIIESRPIGRTPGFYLKFSTSLSQQPSETEMLAIAQNISNLKIKTKARYDEIQLGIINDEIRVIVTKHDDPTQNTKFMIEVFLAMCNLYNSSDNFVSEGSKTIEESYLPSATVEKSVNKATTSVPKKGFFDQLKQLKDQADKFFDSNFKQS